MANELSLYYTQDISQSLPYQQYMRGMSAIADKRAGSINAANAANAAMVQSAINTQTSQILASNNALRQAMGKGFNSVNNTLGRGFDSVNNTLDRGFGEISNQLGCMTHAINMGFAMTEAAIGRMSDAVCARLDALVSIASQPVRTEARHRYHIAFERYQNGYFPDALQAVTEALKLDDNDYLSWFLMGRIYAFGAGELSNVINLDKAIDAYKKAAYYVTGPAKRSEDAKPVAAEICFYLGLAQLPKSHELRRAGKTEEAAKLLADARASFEQSYRYSDRMLESLYNTVRCKVLQRDGNGILSAMKTLIEQDWPYYIKALADSDFAPIHGKVPVLVTKMRDEVYAQAAPVMRDIAGTWEQAKREGLLEYFDQSNKALIEDCISKGLDPNLPYVDMRNRYTYLQELRGEKQ
jgi:tetratricopeptide (TPR) repeat protein